MVENEDEQRLTADEEGSLPVRMQGGISKKMILLIACLCALCDCLLLSVIGKYSFHFFLIFVRQAYVYTSLIRALKSHALSVSITHFDAISCRRKHFSRIGTFLEGIKLPFKLSEALMNTEFVPSLTLNFDQC